MTDTKPHFCGRYEDDRAGQPPFNLEAPHLRDDGTCSYCGSITSDAFFEAVEAGCVITPTDKNYKAYVDMPDPQAGEPTVRACSNDTNCPTGWEAADPAILAESGWRGPYKWMLRMPRPATKFAKFYFQHLTEEEKHRFVALLNQKKFNFATPGHFYNPPYFVSYK